MNKRRAPTLQKKTWKRILTNWRLYVLLLPAIAYYIAFQYVPMYGVVLAFKKLTIKGGLLGSPWADPPSFYFKQLFADPAFWNALKNTLMIGIYKLVFYFPVPILIAILLHEIRGKMFKKTVQTIIYLPRFISWTIMASLVMNILSVNGGVLNSIITAFGGEPVNFLMDASKFRTILVITTILKDAGWGSIIYYAAISGVSPELYEACEIDGGSRLTKMWHVTLPAIKPTITIMLILTIGNILIQDTQQVLTLYSPNVYTTGDILGTYIFRTGIQNARYSFATAANLFNSPVSLILILIANGMSKKLGEESLF